MAIAMHPKKKIGVLVCKKVYSLFCGWMSSGTGEFRGISKEENVDATVLLLDIACEGLARVFARGSQRSAVILGARRL